jgi:alpha-tubulin suppressor-like RCC1 family protein
MFTNYDGEAYKIRGESSNLHIKKVADNIEQIYYFNNIAYMRDIDNNMLTIPNVIMPNNISRMYLQGVLTFAVDAENTIWVYNSKTRDSFRLIAKDAKQVLRAHNTKFVVLYENGEVCDSMGKVIAKDIKQIICMCTHIYTIDINNNLSSFGRCGTKQLLSHVKEYKRCWITSNEYIIRDDETLWVCGTNEYGALGVGNCESVGRIRKIMENVSSIEALRNITFVLDNDGILWSSGSTHYTFIKFADDVAQIKRIGEYCCILKYDRTLWVLDYKQHPVKLIQIAENVKTLANCEIEPAKYPKSARNCAD